MTPPNPSAPVLALASCPFCGHAAECASDIGDYFVACQNPAQCNALIEGFPTEAEAIAAWNNRVPTADPALPIRSEGVVSALADRVGTSAARPAPLGAEVVEVVGAAIRDLSCGYSMDGGRVFCDDPRLEPHLKHIECECKLAAQAAIAALVPLIRRQRDGEIVEWLRSLADAELTPSIVAFFGDPWGDDGQRLLGEIATAIDRGEASSGGEG